MSVLIADKRRPAARPTTGRSHDPEGAGARLSRSERAWLAKIASAAMAAESCDPSIELSVAIGDDEWIQDLNERYKGKRAPTDVLAFPQEAEADGPSPLLGDVAVSAETAARQAKEMGHGLMVELALLVIHGILHLTGWEDGTVAQRRRMLRRATALLEEAAPDVATGAAPMSAGEVNRPAARGRCI